MISALRASTAGEVALQRLAHPRGQGIVSAKLFKNDGAGLGARGVQRDGQPGLHIRIAFVVGPASAGARGAAIGTVEPGRTHEGPRPRGDFAKPVDQRLGRQGAQSHRAHPGVAGLLDVAPGAAVAKQEGGRAALTALAAPDGPDQSRPGGEILPPGGHQNRITGLAH